MVYTLADLEADVQSYTQYDDPDFVAMIPTFIQQAEERIWYFVQLPFFRKNVTGSFSAGNKYLQLPDDFLAPASLAVIVLNEYTYLLNKDVNYMREVYPDPTVTGVPRYYALFSADADDTTIIVAPTPTQSYAAELHYFYKPASLTAGAPSGTTWLSEHAYDALLYGTLSEAANWMKRTSGIDGMADAYDQRFLLAVQGLQNLGEARDRKDVYRGGEKKLPER